MALDAKTRSEFARLGNPDVTDVTRILRALEIARIESEHRARSSEIHSLINGLTPR